MLSEIVSKSWVNIHTSKTEGFGYSILEASSAGTPTVAYNVPGVQDVIENGVNGYLVPDTDRRKLATIISEIINSYNDRWIIDSRRTGLKYSWEVAASGWEKYLCNLS